MIYLAHEPKELCELLLSVFVHHSLSVHLSINIPHTLIISFETTMPVRTKLSRTFLPWAILISHWQKFKRSSNDLWFSPLLTVLILSWTGIKHAQILLLICWILKNLSQNWNIQIVFFIWYNDVWEAPHFILIHKKKTWLPLAVCFWLAEMKNLFGNYRSKWFVTLYKCMQIHLQMFLI